MSETRFFPFDPRFVRSGLALGAFSCVAAGLWALYGPGSGGGLAEARAGLCAGLLLAFWFVRFRLRPRQGWGVVLSPRELIVARPLSGDLATVPWTELRHLSRGGRRRDYLVLLLTGDRRLLLPRHLFPSREAFEALAAAIEERTPPSRFDA